MPDLQVPPSWRDIDLSNWSGLVFVLGGTDTGKTTAVRLFYDALQAAGRSVAVIDGDPGQSTLGPPTTLTVALPPSEGTSTSPSFPPTQRLRHWFVGAPTPRGHMLEMVVGGQRLLDVVQGAGPDVVVYDTTGFITVRRGGRALKYALLDLLRPTTVVALQRNDELEPLLTPLRQRPSLRIIERPAAEAAAHRSTRERRQYRAHGFTAHFEEATMQEIYWPDLAVRPNLDFCENQLVAFTTESGFVQALGRVETVDRDAYTVTVETPLRALTSVAQMRLGDVNLDPGTYEDTPL